MAGFWKRNAPKPSGGVLNKTKHFLKGKIETLKTAAKKRTMKQFASGTVSNPKLGQMLFYVYDPKWKNYLPLYDTLPLIIVIGVYSDGWLGMNLHYLPPVMRYKFLQQLAGIANNKNFSNKKKMVLTYRMLNGVATSKWFEPTIHRYLTRQVRSPLLKIEQEDWEAVVFLPTASWRKGKPY